MFYNYLSQWHWRLTHRTKQRRPRHTVRRWLRHIWSECTLRFWIALRSWTLVQERRQYSAVQSDIERLVASVHQWKSRSRSRQIYLVKDQVSVWGGSGIRHWCNSLNYLLFFPPFTRQNKLNRGEERNGEKNSIDFNMKSSSSEESVRKRSHSVGGNQFANTLTTSTICDINIDNLDTKQDLIGEY